MNWAKIGRNLKNRFYRSVSVFNFEITVEGKPSKLRIVTLPLVNPHCTLTVPGESPQTVSIEEAVDLIEHNHKRQQTNGNSTPET